MVLLARGRIRGSACESRNSAITVVVGSGRKRGISASGKDPEKGGNNM